MLLHAFSMVLHESFSSFFHQFWRFYHGFSMVLPWFCHALMMLLGASRAQQALLRGAPVNRRYADRQKQRALAIQRHGLHQVQTYEITSLEVMISE